MGCLHLCFTKCCVFAKQRCLWPWARVRWSVNLQFVGNAYLLLMSCHSVLIHAVMLLIYLSKRSSSTTEKGSETPILAIPSSKLFVTFVSEFCCGSFICCCQGWWIYLQIHGISVSGWITAMTGNFFFFTAEYNSHSSYGSWGHLQHPLNHAKAQLLCIFVFFILFFFYQETFDAVSFSMCLDSRPYGTFQQDGIWNNQFVWGAPCLGIAFLLPCCLLQESWGRDAVLPPTPDCPPGACLNFSV